MKNPKSKKSFLQQITIVFSYLCLLSAAICALILMINFADFPKVYRASFAASTFFFVVTGFVLREITKTAPPPEN
jgi:energy-converting hydrogenase Eha subunit A